MYRCPFCCKSFSTLTGISEHVMHGSDAHRGNNRQFASDDLYAHEKMREYDMSIRAKKRLAEMERKFA